jgi:ribonuclease HII
MMYEYENRLLKEGYHYIAGCDEVGRGPLAGPLVAAAVVLDPDIVIEGLDDSKKLSDKKRQILAKRIREHALVYKVVFIDNEDVDRLNVYKASQKAMTDAVNALGKIEYVLSDALPLPALECPVTSIIKGDSKSASIAAASILAKVERDAYMMDLGKTYPAYGFETHKGYPTKAHLAALEEFGITPHHRKTYAPVKKLIEKQMSLNI